MRREDQRRGEGIKRSKPFTGQPAQWSVSQWRADAERAVRLDSDIGEAKVTPRVLNLEWRGSLEKKLVVVDEWMFGWRGRRELRVSQKVGEDGGPTGDYRLKRRHVFVLVPGDYHIIPFPVSRFPFQQLRRIEGSLQLQRARPRPGNGARTSKRQTSNTKQPPATSAPPSHVFTHTHTHTHNVKRILQTSLLQLDDRHETTLSSSCDFLYDSQLRG